MTHTITKTEKKAAKTDPSSGESQRQAARPKRTPFNPAQATRRASTLRHDGRLRQVAAENSGSRVASTRDSWASTGPRNNPSRTSRTTSERVSGQRRRLGTGSASVATVEETAALLDRLSGPGAEIEQLTIDVLGVGAFAGGRSLVAAAYGHRAGLTRG